MIKKIFSFLSITLLLFLMAQAQEPYEFTFKIQVSASTKPLAKTSTLYKTLPEVETVQFEDGYIRYFVGKYETFHAAKEGLQEVKDKGYKDAYIICIHKGKRLTVDEAIMKIYEEE